MSFLLPATGSNRYITENVPASFVNLIKLCLTTILIYVVTCKIKNICKNGIFARLKKFKERTELVNLYPGLGVYSIYGSTPKMVSLISKPCRYALPWFTHMAQKYGPIYRYWVFGQPKLFIACPETAVACLKNGNFSGRSSEFAEIGRAIGGEGLLAASADNHGPLKKMWKQWFTRNLINSNLGMFQREAIQLSEALSTKTTTFDVVDYALHCTFRIIARTALGNDYMNQIPEDTGKHYSHNLTTLSINLFSRTFRPWLSNDFVYFNLTTDGRETMRCVKDAQGLTWGAIKYKKMLRNNKIRPTDAATNVPCFLDHLLNIHEQGELTEYQIFQELNDFIVAGYDTSGLSICWALYLLACHPNSQALVVEELHKLFDGNIKQFTSEITRDHLKNMRYLELCIKETLRLYPASPIIFRQSDPHKIIVMPDGNKIPPGVDAYISAYLVHQDPNYFPEPEKFIPERHLNPTSAYIPFGNGSRSCIGQVYAIQEMKMILAHLLMEYEWKTLEKAGMEPFMGPLCYPENGLRFQISKRTHSSLYS